jgi:hypothetical protein
MDDWARDCVVRLATALMMRSFASDFCKWPANGNRPPWMQEIGHRQ